MFVVGLLISCNNEKKEQQDVLRIFSEYHYALDTVLKSKEGIVSGVELGQNMKFKGTAHMIKDGGIWKFDATSTSGADSQQYGKDLFGTPDTSGGSGGAMGSPTPGGK